MQRNFLVWRKLMVTSIAGNLAEPLIYRVGLGYGVGALIGDIDDRPYITFLAAGMICYSTMNSASFEALYSAFARLQIQRTWEGILHAPLTSDDVVVGEWLWAGLKALFSGTAILLVMTALARSYDFFTYYFALLVTPMTFLSGIYFPLRQLPEIAQHVAWWLPLAHAASLARGLTLVLSTFVLMLYGISGVGVACWHADDAERAPYRFGARGILDGISEVACVFLAPCRSPTGSRSAVRSAAARYVCC